MGGGGIGIDTQVFSYVEEGMAYLFKYLLMKGNSCLCVFMIFNLFKAGKHHSPLSKITDF